VKGPGRRQKRFPRKKGGTEGKIGRLRDCSLSTTQKKNEVQQEGAGGDTLGKKPGDVGQKEEANWPSTCLNYNRALKRRGEYPVTIPKKTGILVRAGLTKPGGGGGGNGTAEL